jgi:hypothetical protein
VTGNLALHRRQGERHKVCANVDVEAVDGVEQADPSSLHEVVKWFAPPAVSVADVVGDWQTALDSGLALTPECRRSSSSTLK